ncbi:MAG: HlyD family efflux transporter periplasmic adaptor subunit [Clostridia bacterium]|nr:HlyD family efflux transporter periplasmic adaptor subunit [Clostridia bacterium]
MKRVFRCALLAALAASLAAPALADSWEGVTVAADTVLLTAPCDGVLERLTVTVGERVSAGDTAGAVASVPVFSPCDGRVAAVMVKEGERANGEKTLEIEPVGRYRVICTVSGVAKTPEDAWVRCGETLWMKCTADGSHRAAGRVVSVSGTTFEIETTAGELYIGETVWVCRDEACAADGRIGKGTVTAAPTVSVSADGVILDMRAREGASVRRGQLLFRTAPEAGLTVTVPADGVVTRLEAAVGDTVRAGGTVAVAASSAALRAEIPLERALSLKPGDRLFFIRADDPHETLRPATVTRVLTDGAPDTAAVELSAAEDLPVGLRVTLTDDGPLPDYGPLPDDGP